MNTSTRTPNGHFPKGKSGNPSGRPIGSRNKSSLLVEQLFEDEAEQLTRKAIDLAKQGNPVAMRLCMERILAAAQRARFLSLDLEPAQSAADLPQAFQSIFAAVANGSITPGEGESLANIARNQAQMTELVELERRIQELEGFSSEVKAYHQEASRILYEPSAEPKP